MASESPKIYLESLNAYTLGYSHVEFYEAFLVTNLRESELEGLMKNISELCGEFPKLDKYVTRIFSDDKLANPQVFKSAFGSNIGGNSSKASPASINSYIAEINSKGELVLFPFSETKRKVINVGYNWCTNKVK